MRFDFSARLQYFTLHQKLTELEKSNSKTNENQTALHQTKTKSTSTKCQTYTQSLIFCSSAWTVKTHFWDCCCCVTSVWVWLLVFILIQIGFSAWYINISQCVQCARTPQLGSSSFVESSAFHVENTFHLLDLGPLRTLNISYNITYPAYFIRIFFFWYPLLSPHLRSVPFHSRSTDEGQHKKMQTIFSVWFDGYVSIFLTVVSSILSILLKFMTAPFRIHFSNSFTFEVMPGEGKKKWT